MRLTTCTWRLSSRLSSWPLVHVRYAHLSPARTFALRLPAQNHLREPPEDVTPIPLAIVGRPNVGKSTLFNRLLSGTKKGRTIVSRGAIVGPRAGTTRDKKDAVAVFGGLLLRVIDTGGLESEKMTRESTLLASMRQQVFKAITEAAAVLFVVDAREGITGLDLEVSQLLANIVSSIAEGRPSTHPNRPALPVIVVANKAEGSFLGPYLNDCFELGFGEPVILSAQHNEGMEELYDRLCLEVGHLQDDTEAAAEEDEEEDQEEEEAEEDEDEEEEEDEEVSEEEEEGPAPPTIPWMPPSPLSPRQAQALRYYASHPGDPFGNLDDGVKASLLHKLNSPIGNHWLRANQASLPNKEVRDYVMNFRRLEDWEKPMKLAVVGLPNAGKSSIINALMQEERCVVDPTDGTTRDAIVTNWSFRDHPVKLIDTCGVYRGWNYPGMYNDMIEPGIGTRKAIRRSDIVVLCIDANLNHKMGTASPTKFETNLGRYCVEEGKGLVIAINKWDLIDEETQPKEREAILKKVQDRFHKVRGLPVVFMSAKYSLNLSTLMTRAFALYKRWNARLPTSKLNSWLQAWMLRWPPPWRHGQKMSVKYMTQTRARPPTFVLWTNTTAGEMPPNYLKQLQNSMRDEFRISGVPMRFILRSTLMPKPRKKLSKWDVLRWKRVGPKQAEAVSRLNAKKMIKKMARQTH